MKNRAMFLALAAGGLAAMPTLANEPTGEVRMEVLPTMRVDANGQVIPGSATPFQTNAIGIVYDQISTAFGGPNLTFLASTHIIDDTNFNPGPWVGVTGRAITQMSAAWGNAGTVPLQMTILIRVWDQDDVNFNGFSGAGTPMINPTAVEKGRIVVNPTTNNGIVSYQEFIFTTPIPIDDDDTGVFVEACALPFGATLPAANAPGGGSLTPAPLTPLAATLWGTGSVISPGSNTPNIGRDRNNDGTFTGNPVGANPIEHNSSTAFRYPVIMRGDIPPPAPPATRTNLGCLTDAGLVQNLANDGLQWFEFCLNGAADDASLQFLDIDTEGSVGDLEIGLYGTDGNIVGLANLTGIDTADGSGAGNAQLTFGVGRRAPVDDGRDYDGRDGQLPAGTYFLAVGGAGTTFAPGFIATAPAPTGAGGTLNFRTNTNGAALAASVAPTVALTEDFSATPFTFGADALQATTDAVMAVRGVVWAKFATAAAAAAADNTYLDVNFNFANSTVGADGVAYVFDSSGNEVAFSDDTGVAPNLSGLPQFSFGATAPARTRGTNPNSFNGENGDLPAGTYYMAMALFATQDISGAPSGERWHVRGTSASGLDVNAQFYTGVGITCDSIDFNNDGLFPDDSDLVDFLSVLAGGVCSNDPNCNDIDFNNDGLFPDDNDLVAYLSVLAGGPC